jgi:hypothetical protein
MFPKVIRVHLLPEACQWIEERVVAVSFGTAKVDAIV